MSLSAVADRDALKTVEGKIDTWHLGEARARFEKLDANTLDLPRARFVLGKLLFFEGRYKDSQAELRRAIEGARTEFGWKMLRDRAAESERALSRLDTETGKSGRFRYRFAKGQDALLVPYADRALARQLDALEKVLGDRPGYVIEIDFLPDVESLAAASGLKAEQIERTGTVGVSKYGRVMIISPSRLATGYPWLDTLAHELTHVLITRVSGNRAPIWLHEGIAKFLERRWRGELLGDLTPSEAYLLDRAAREGRLIPLRKFHPSVAHLPNQEDAALAYAQVLSFIRYLSGRLPEDWLRRLLERLGQGDTVEEAFQTFSKHSVRRNYRWWRQAVSGRRQTPVPAVGLMKRRFIRGKVAEESGLESLLGVDVRRYLRIGDLLRLRGHVKAAVKEYRQAERLAASPSPEISDRLAACLLDLGDVESVAELLPQMTDLYPFHLTVFVQLGHALAALEKYEQAADAFERANALNPFHPAIHCALADIYAKLGRGKEADLETEHCRLIATRAALSADKKSLAPGAARCRCGVYPRLLYRAGNGHLLGVRLIYLGGRV